MTCLLIRIAAGLLLGSLGLQADAQVLTKAETRAHNHRVESGWQGIELGDSASSVVTKMGFSGSIIQDNDGRGERWQYFTVHITYAVIIRDGKVVAKQSKLE